MRTRLLGQWQAIRAEWSDLTMYQRFESTVALMLTLIVSLVIVVALYRLLVSVLTGLVFGALDPLEHTVFQTVFGEIMALLIALEFNHTLQYVVNRTQSIIQTKILLLIALLAAPRKVIILDLQTLGVGPALGLAAIILVLGLTCWLIREQDDHLPGTTFASVGEWGRADRHEHPPEPQMQAASAPLYTTTRGRRWGASTT
jgi:uncharacterized membrane protein (DUF373 family)